MQSKRDDIIDKIVAAFEEEINRAAGLTPQVENSKPKTAALTPKSHFFRPKQGREDHHLSRARRHRELVADGLEKMKW